ncbi:MAG: endonuclease NucS [Candidatus Odinarchaeia archaeon]
MSSSRYINRVRVIKDASFKEYVSVLNDALLKGYAVFIVGLFKVDYEGRANSFIDFGERFLIIKRDKVVLVHQDKGIAPINWQPSGVSVKVQLDKDVIVLTAYRRYPKEKLVITFKKVYLLTIMDLKDESDFILNASEKQMQEAVYRKPDLLFNGFKPIRVEKKVEPGFIDVYGYDKEGNLVIVELKRVLANKSAVIQLWKYLESFSKGSDVSNIRGILAAPGITKDAELLLERLGLEFKRLDPFKCSEVLREFSVKFKKLTDYI